MFAFLAFFLFQFFNCSFLIICFRLSYNYIIPPPSPQPFHIALLALSHIINCVDIINIYKLYIYLLLSLYIVTRMLVFRADHLVLDS